MPPAAPHLLVDGMNVIGSRPTGWWRDRDAAVWRLVTRLQELAVAESRAVTAIFDGRPPPGLPPGIYHGLEVLYAPRQGRNAADDRLVGFIEAYPKPRSLEVVTSDRELARRAEGLGARVRSSGWLLQRLDRMA